MVFFITCVDKVHIAYLKVEHTKAVISKTPSHCTPSLVLKKTIKKDRYNIYFHNESLSGQVAYLFQLWYNEKTNLLKRFFAGPEIIYECVKFWFTLIYSSFRFLFQHD